MNKEEQESFSHLESNVRAYSRSFPAVFARATGSTLIDVDGKQYIDFLAGAGALNLGHNHPDVKRAVLEYLESDQVIHALDLFTPAKREFLELFESIVLRPRDLDYRLQFCGPTGTNAVGAALKLARKVTGRETIVSFFGSYHGLSAGSLSVSGNINFKSGLRGTNTAVHFLPFPGLGASPEQILEQFEFMLETHYAGIGTPAAVLIEPVQAEGGVNIAPADWLAALAELCSRHGVLLICDEIQVGYHRTGPFFSFEHAKIKPDIVTLSKSISGYGGPMSLLLMRPELDVWAPGEHSGTFRGYQLALVGAGAGLRVVQSSGIQEQVLEKEKLLHDVLHGALTSIDQPITLRGVGMIWGLDFSQAGGGEITGRIVKACFEDGLIIERVGLESTVLKVLPPLTIGEEELLRGCEILVSNIKRVLG